LDERPVAKQSVLYGGRPDIFSHPATGRRPAPLLMLVGVAAFSAGVVALLTTSSRELAIVALGVVGVPAILWGATYAARHRTWLIFALLLSDQLFSFDLLPPAVQTSGHYVVTFLVCLPALPYLRRYRILGEGGFRLYAIYFCWCLVTVAYSIAPVVSMGRLLAAMLGFSAISVAVFEIEDRADVARLLGRVVLACGLVLVAVAASAVLLPHALTWGVADDRNAGAIFGLGKRTLEDAYRFRGIFGSPNQLGALMVLTVGPALALWPSQRGWRRLGLATVIASSICFAALADSRTAFVAVAVGVASYVIWKYRLRGALICAAAALILSFVVIHQVRSSPQDSGNGARSVSTLSDRTIAWKFTVGQIEQRPLTGYGYEVEGAIFRNSSFPLWWGPWDLGARIAVHNGYLARASGVGIPALLFWLFIALRPWVALFRHKDDPWNLKPIALLVLVPILVHNMAESSAGDFIFGLGLLFGAIWAIGERYRLLAIQREQAARAEHLAQLPRAVAAILG
jgi:O-Antigen ligase